MPDINAPTLQEFGIDTELDTNPAYLKLFNYDWKAWLRDYGDLGETRGSKDDPAVYINCPWKAEHSSDVMTGTMLFTPENDIPVFYCHHAHCQGRTMVDVFNHQGEKMGKYLKVQDKKSDSKTETASDDTIKTAADSLGSHPDIASCLTFLGETDDGQSVIKSIDSEILKFVSPASITDKVLLGIYSDIASWKYRFGKPAAQRGIQIDTLHAAEWMLAESKKVGIFGNRTRCGLGMYKDRMDSCPVVVVNTGRDVECNGKRYIYTDAWKILKNFYFATGRSITIGKTPPSKETATLMRDTIRSLTFSTQDFSDIFFGCMLSHMIPGILFQIPIVQLNGPSGSGKTKIVELIARPLIDTAGGFTVTLGSTVAGVAQGLCGNISVIFDEFEPENPKNVAIIEGINDMALSSTTGGSYILKGTKSGKPTLQAVKAGFTFSAVGNSARIETLERRSIFFNLRLAEETNDSWIEKYKRIIGIFTDETCSNVLRFLVNNTDLVLKNIESCASIIAKKIPTAPNYIPSLYSVPAGCYHTFVEQSEIVESSPIIEAVLNVINASILTQSESTEAPRSEQTLIDFVNKLMTVGIKNEHTNKVYQLQELLDRPNDPLEPLSEKCNDATSKAELLLLYGLKIKDETLFFASKHRKLEKVFEEQLNIKSHKSIFKSIKDSSMVYSTEKFRGILSKAYGIPLVKFTGETPLTTEEAVGG
jgi:energy-coupling factor transporter ATP-binding protein EcfA2